MTESPDHPSRGEDSKEDIPADDSKEDIPADDSKEDMPADDPADDSKEDMPADEKSAEAQSSETAGDPQIGSGEAPGPGGYEGRDPKTDMPRVPGEPDTQDDDE